mgnify:CR=1 FL=1
MAGSLNKVMLIGNLGNDPEIRTFEGGDMLARLSIATSESYNSKKTGEKVTLTEWHTIVLRTGLAKIAEKYLKKGDKVYIEGKLKTRSWEENGAKKFFTEIRADQMTMLSTKSTNGAPIAENNAVNLEQSTDSNTDDLPF